MLIVMAGVSMIYSRGGVSFWKQSAELKAVTWNMAAINNNPFGMDVADSMQLENVLISCASQSTGSQVMILITIS